MSEIGKIELVWCQMKPNCSSKTLFGFCLKLVNFHSMLFLVTFLFSNCILILFYFYFYFIYVKIIIFDFFYFPKSNYYYLFADGV